MDIKTIIKDANPDIEILPDALSIPVPVTPPVRY